MTWVESDLKAFSLFITFYTDVRDRAQLIFHILLHISLFIKYYARRHRLSFFESLAWFNLALNPSLPGHRRTLDPSANESVVVFNWIISNVISFFKLVFKFVIQHLDIVIKLNNYQLPSYKCQLISEHIRFERDVVKQENLKMPHFHAEFRVLQSGECSVILYCVRLNLI